MSKIKTGTSLAAGFIGGIAFLVGCGGSDPVNNAVASAEELWQSFSNHIYFTDGNVGIGTDAPQELIHLKTSINEDPAIYFEQGEPIHDFRIITGSWSGNYGFAIQDMTRSRETNEVPKFYIDNSGNLGIGGTVTPQSALAVNGLPTSPPDTSGNAGVVCVTNDGNFWLDSDGTADCS